MVDFEFVDITKEDGSILYLPIDHDGTLDLEILKIYLSNANGLTYTQNNLKRGLQIRKNKLILIPDIQDYNVHTEKNG